MKNFDTYLKFCGLPSAVYPKFIKQIRLYSTTDRTIMRQLWTAARYARDSVGITVSIFAAIFFFNLRI